MLFRSEGSVAADTDLVQRFRCRHELKVSSPGTSPAVQWLRLHASTAGGVGSIPGQGTKIPHAVWGGQKIFFKKLN